MQLKKNIEKYIKKSNVDDGEVEQTIWKALRHLLFSFLIVLIITAISPLSKELQLQEYVAVLVRNTVIFYVIGSFLLLFKRGGFYFSLYSVAWIIVAIANALVTKFRGTPITKYDFLMIKEGFSLSKDFERFRLFKDRSNINTFNSGFSLYVYKIKRVSEIKG